MLQSARCVIWRDVVSTSVTKWIINVDMDGWGIRLWSCLANMAGLLAKVSECKTVQGHHTIRISIIVMLNKLLVKFQMRL